MLTKRQKQILDYIKKFINENEFAPSLEEIRKHFKLSSIATVHQHIETLRAKGELKKIENQPRSIEIPKNKFDSNLTNIFILGTIAAGKPIEAIEDIEIIQVPKSQLPKTGEYDALRVSGDSMIDKGIFDKDIVIIKKQPTAENGETVAAILNGDEITLKKFYKEKNRFRLQPANPNLKPIFVKKLEIHGKVISVIRNFENTKPKSAVALFGDKNDKSFLSFSLKPKALFEMPSKTFKDKKELFLKKIKSVNPNSQNKYKRVALSTIRYAGGKSLAVGHVIELLPDNTKKVVSPFFGGGSIEIAMSKELDLEVIGYDIFDILCNYWKFQIENPELLYKKLKELKPDKKTFEKIRMILNDVWKKKIKLDTLTLAVYYVYNFNLSYGPGFMGWASDIYLNETRYKRMIERIKNFAPKNLKVKCTDFQRVIKNHSNDFLYCDPPYYIGEDSKMFKGIYPMRNIPVHHNGFPHETLRDLLKYHMGGFILSYNNCSTIRKYYKEFQQSFPIWQYTMGQGETRIGKNRIENGDNHIKQSHEIIIFCPPRK